MACGAGLGHAFQRFGLDEGRVAIQDKGIARGPVQRLAGLCHGMGRAQLLGLFGDGDVRIHRKCGAAHGFDPVAGDQYGALGIQRCARGQRVGEQGATPDLVQHLGKVGLHPRALTRGQNDQVIGHDCSFLLPAAVLPVRVGLTRPGGIKVLNVMLHEG